MKISIKRIRTDVKFLSPVETLYALRRQFPDLPAEELAEKLSRQTS